ncbi:acyltransferase family protein [Streptomyces sp. NPDC048462]|uniref:acyltransferase family protein n=1 Tax=Streptomyces sp. NPDC048462 TaxID=3365555 RepID=UPI00371E6D8A
MDTSHGAGTAPISARPAPDPRLGWLDTLRIALIVMVVAHHCAQAYGPADWWYVEAGPRSDFLATLSALDGTFFMSLFFFVSAYFVPASYSRRGGGSFVRGRLLRLGVPVLIGALTLVPALMYAYYTRYRGYPDISFPRYFADVYLGLGERPADWSGPSWPDLQFGHLWFIQNLLAYSLLYALCRAAVRSVRRSPATDTAALAPRRVLGHLALLALTVVLTGATFAARVRYPLDTWVPFLDFIQVEPARVPQYAGFFVLGILARRGDWLVRLPARTGRVWLWAGLAGSCLLFAVGADAPFFGAGGADGASLLWSAYDSLLCVALCTGLLVFFREKARWNTRFSRSLAGDSFAVYVIHVPIVVALQFAVAGHGLPALGAFALVTACAVPVSFAAAHGLRRIPGFRRVL